MNNNLFEQIDAEKREIPKIDKTIKHYGNNKRGYKI